MYSKLFIRIVDSSIWMESNATRLCWLTCLAVMDEDGFVSFASVSNLAHRARVSLKAAQAAVECLEGPDPNSSDPENEGRRLERVPGRVDGPEREEVRGARHQCHVTRADARTCQTPPR